MGQSITASTPKEQSLKRQRFQFGSCRASPIRKAFGAARDWHVPDIPDVHVQLLVYLPKAALNEGTDVRSSHGGSRRIARGAGWHMVASSGSHDQHQSPTGVLAITRGILTRSAARHLSFSRVPSRPAASVRWRIVHEIESRPGGWRQGCVNDMCHGVDRCRMSSVGTAGTQQET